MATSTDTATNLGISSEEFEQYQRQFIDERAEKYALLEKVRKLEQENARLSTEKIDKEFDVRIIKDKFQKPLQNFLSRNKRESESDIHVQQENDVLQKRLHSQEEDFQRQNALLMQELQTLIVRNEDLERRVRSLDHDTHDGSSEKATDLEAQLRTLLAELAVHRKPTEDGAGDQIYAADDGDQSDGVEELRFKLATAEEEKLLLRDELAAAKLSLEEKLLDAERTAETLRRDLADKQTSVQLLLTERDQQQKMFNDRLNSLLTEKENMRLVCKAELDKMKDENLNLRQTVEEEKVMARARVEDVERQMKDLLEQMDMTSHQTKRDTDELLTEHKNQIAALFQDVERLQGENTTLQNFSKELDGKFKAAEDERSRLSTSETELIKLCEKRKATIEDLTFHLDKVKRQHEEELQRKQNELSRSVEPIRLRLEMASAEASKVPALQSELENLKKETILLRDHQDHWATESEKYKNEYETRIRTLEAETTRLTTSHDLLLSQSSEEVSRLSENLQMITEERDHLAKELSLKSTSFDQQLQDKAEEQKIADRKNAGVVRDLQKQLHAEKRRLEKLQSRLNEVLRDGGTKAKVLPDDSADFTERDETGSVSSWSFVSSKSNHKKQSMDARSSSSKTETETGQGSMMTDQEIKDMVGRITKLQQEKAILMEKVTMLESGNAAMAEDLLNKSALITRHLHSAPDRLGRDKTIDAETQKNLRHLLEETLTKNIHLQKNMELLTEELDRLRGSSPPRSL